MKDTIYNREISGAVLAWAPSPSGTDPWPSRLRRRLFAISEEEVTVTRRGFLCDTDEVREKIESVGRSFLFGYHAAVASSGPEGLGAPLSKVEPELRGFAYEGAAMALCLLDFLTPWDRSRFETFLEGPGEPHAYMAFVGAGWAVARLPFVGTARLRTRDPLLYWLALDGCGFHAGYFDWPRFVKGRKVPAWLCFRASSAGMCSYGRQAFDQGLGRSLWFSQGADPQRISEAVTAFPFVRRGDLWSGVGLAATYTGWAGAAELLELRDRSGDFSPQLAQGSAFAAKARLRAGNPTRRTDVACRALCGMSAAEAAEVTDDALLGLSHDGEEPAYEVWRRRIQKRFSASRG